MREQDRSPRVCVFTSAHDTTDSRVVTREATTLEEAGYDVTYYTPFSGECPVDVVSYGDVDDGTLPGISDRLAWTLDVARLLADTDYDVYHFHDPELLPVGVALGRLTDGTVLYDVHENLEDVLRHKPIFPEPVRPYLATLASKVECGLARFVDGIVAASPDIAERYEGYDDVTVVTNYPKRKWAEETDLSAPPSMASDPDGEQVVNAMTDGSGDGPIRFIYRGLLSEDRGILTIIDAIDRVPDEYDVSLVLGGKYASDEEQERIEARMAESDRVEFVEWLPSLGDVIDLFRDADVGVMCFQPAPNKTNAAHRSNKLFQYMAAGLPIIVSDIGNWSEIVEEVDCGVAVDPGSPDEIAEAMTALADDPDRRRSLGRNGHQAALDRFNWESQRENLLDVYERHVGRPSAYEREQDPEDRDDSAGDRQDTARAEGSAD